MPRLDFLVQAGKVGVPAIEMNDEELDEELSAE